MPLIDYGAALTYDRRPLVGLTGSAGGGSKGFRTLASPGSITYPITPSREVLKAQALRIVTVSTPTQWDNAVSNSKAGDFIDVVSTISRSGGFNYRGSKWNIKLSNGGANGTAANPVVISCAPGVFFDGGGLNTFEPALDINNVDYVWAVDINVRNSTFGFRSMNVEGDNTNRVRFARMYAENIGYSAFVFQGWWQELDIYDPANTRPAGEEFSYGYTRYFIVEGCYASSAGLINTQFGESFYFGRGSAPGWVGWASDGIIRFNVAENFTADGIELKPGCERITGYGNIARYGRMHFGAAYNLLYVSGGIDDRPTWRSGDPEIYWEQNRCYDLNISKTSGTTGHWPIKVGLAGCRVANNEVWSWRDANGNFGTADTLFRAIRVQIEKPVAQFGTHPTWIINSTFWGGGVDNFGSGGTPITALNGAVDLDLRNNLVPVGYNGGTHTADINGADFAGPNPAVGQLSEADWNSQGPGSAFNLDDATSLADTGSSIADLTLKLGSEDIFRRTIDTDPEPGAFQLSFEAA